MTTGLYAFRDVRCVPETVAGTKIDAATARLLGKLTAPISAPILHKPEDEIGSLAANTRAVVVGEDANLSFEGDCTFEQLIYLLEMGILANGSPTGEGPYVWEYKHDLTAQSTPKSFTFQYGDDEAQYDVAYVVAKSLQISGKMNAPMTMKAEMFGRNLEATVWNPVVGALASQTVETMLGNKMRLYIDAAGGTIGSTEKSATIISMDWKLDTGYLPKMRGSANNFFTALGQKKPQLTVDIRAEFNSDMEAEAAIARAGTRRLFRLAVAGAGTSALQLDWSGVYDVFGPLENEEGIDVVKFTTSLQLDTVFADLLIAQVTNSVSALT